MCRQPGCLSAQRISAFPNPLWLQHGLRGADPVPVRISLKVLLSFDPTGEEPSGPRGEGVGG